MLLGEGLFNRVSVLVPRGSFELETEAVAAIFDLCNLSDELGLPVESLGHISLDV